MELLQNFLDTNETFYKLLGMALAVGNIINGQDPKKSQADGFEFSMIAKLDQINDNQKKGTILRFIVKKMVEDDPELPDRFRGEITIWDTPNIDYDALKKSFVEAKGKFLNLELA